MSDSEAEGEADGSIVGEGVGSSVGDGLGSSVGDGLGSFVGDGLGSSVVVVSGMVVEEVSGGLVCPHIGAPKSGGFVGAISDPSPQQSILAWSGVQHGRRPETSISV